jgi:hypothetical protein
MVTAERTTSALGGMASEGQHVAMRTGGSANPTPSPQDAPAKGPVAAWAGWGVCALYWVLISAGYALQLSHHTADAAASEIGWRIGYGSCATVGAVIVSRRPRNVLGWILCTVGLSSAVLASLRTMPALRCCADRSGGPVAW